MRYCPFCVLSWIERASVAADIKLATAERRRLIAGLLARQHLILSGPAGIGKRQLAQTLALAMAQGRKDQVRKIQGHPWWATETGDLAYYIDLQIQFSMWRLEDFIVPVLQRSQPGSQHDQEVGDYAVCIERMSPVEIDLYFDKFPRWLLWTKRGNRDVVPLRLIGTVDSTTELNLSDRILETAAAVHLEGTASDSLGPTAAGSGRQLEQ